MPYFYKVNDYNLHGEKFLDKVEFTISFFSYGCLTKDYSGSIVILLVKINNSIKPHHLDYEYFTEKKIDPELINFKKVKKINVKYIDNNQKLLLHIKDELREWLENNKNSYYFHITCKENLESIKRNGLYAEDEINYEDRIGNRQNNESNNYLNDMNSSNFNTNGSNMSINQAEGFGKNKSKKSKNKSKNSKNKSKSMTKSKSKFKKSKSKNKNKNKRVTKNKANTKSKNK